WLPTHISPWVLYSCWGPIERPGSARTRFYLADPMCLCRRIHIPGPMLSSAVRPLSNNFCTPVPDIRQLPGGLGENQVADADVYTPHITGAIPSRARSWQSSRR